MCKMIRGSIAHPITRPRGVGIPGALPFRNLEHYGALGLLTLALSVKPFANAVGKHIRCDGQEKIDD